MCNGQQNFITPYDEALCNGIKPPLSWAFTSAPFKRRYSTTSILLYPAKNIKKFLFKKYFRFENSRDLPAKWSGVEFRPAVSRQLTFSGVINLRILSTFPRLAASRTAVSPAKKLPEDDQIHTQFIQLSDQLPRSKSATSSSPSFIKSNGVLPSRFFFVGSAPCRNNNLHISNFPLAAASCNGVYFHRSTTLTFAPRLKI